MKKNKKNILTGCLAIALVLVILAFLRVIPFYCIGISIFISVVVTTITFVSLKFSMKK